MIKYAFYKNNENLVIAKSDSNRYLIQYLDGQPTGAQYAEAIDVVTREVDGKPMGRYDYEEGEEIKEVEYEKEPTT